MKYEIESLEKLINSNKVEAVNLLSWDEFHLDFYHLYKDNSLHIDSSDNDSEKQPKLCYIILYGSAELVFPNEVKKLNANDMLIIDFSKPTSYEIYALEETKILYFLTSCNAIIDKKCDDLLELVKEEEEREPDTKNHNTRVGKLAVMIMQIVDPEYNKPDLSFAASYHDVGKLRIDSAVLNKPGKLTDEEFAEIKKHPTFSYNILKDRVGEDIAKIARSHHEKLDGSGYPDGLKADEIPLESKVLAVADIYDALTSKRCYRGSSFTRNEALEIMNKDVIAGKLDKKCYDALVKVSANFDNSY